MDEFVIFAQKWSKIAARGKGVTLFFINTCVEIQCLMQDFLLLIALIYFFMLPGSLSPHPARFSDQCSEYFLPIIGVAERAPLAKNR